MTAVFDGASEALLWLIQMAIVLLVAPLLIDFGAMIRAWLDGRRAGRWGARWRLLLAGWQAGGAVGVEARLALGFAVAALAVLPIATFWTFFPVLADPLAVGLLLLASRAALWRLAASGPAPVWRRDGAALRFVRSEAWRLAALAPMLVLVSALIAIALPGANGLAGLTRNLRIDAAPSLAGGLVFMALAMLAIAPPLLDTGACEALFPRAVGRERAVLRLALDLGACGWCVLLADLAMPGLVAGEGWRGQNPLDWAAMPVRLALMAGLGALFDSWRRPGVAVMLAAAGVALVLAGRLGA
ncbi:hypothetical protein [Acidomonas methanolica]|uniref:hypothetical protein n=1 Tax=Acidomonas methanolica TaxID=437 RepID=UPI00211A406F|nr:hypothetical protein [Acidomonas methanolica]MCQ9156073.1 hypothetical protein [Acidomonas methanolica]